MCAWEEFLYPTASATTYPEIFTALATESANLKISGTTQISIPYPYGTIGMGFLTDLEDHCQWKVMVRAGQKDLIYRGKPVPFVTIGQHLCRTRVERIMNDDSGVAHKQNKKVARVVQPGIDASVITCADAVVALLLAYRTRVHGNIERHTRHSSDVVRLCDSVTDTLAKALSSVQEALARASTSAMGTDQHLLSMRRLARTRYLQILKLSAEIAVFVDLQMDSKWAARLNVMGAIMLAFVRGCRSSMQLNLFLFLEMCNCRDIMYAFVRDWSISMQLESFLLLAQMSWWTKNWLNSAGRIAVLINMLVNRTARV